MLVNYNLNRGIIKLISDDLGITFEEVEKIAEECMWVMTSKIQSIEDKGNVYDHRNVVNDWVLEIRSAFRKRQSIKKRKQEEKLKSSLNHDNRFNTDINSPEFWSKLAELIKELNK